MAWNSSDSIRSNSNPKLSPEYLFYIEKFKVSLNIPLKNFTLLQLKAPRFTRFPHLDILDIAPEILSRTHLRDMRAVIYHLADTTQLCKFNMFIQMNKFLEH